MSYYEQKIAALEARIEEMANLERMKAVRVEAQLMDRLGELKAENARLKAEVERLIITEQNQTERVISLEDCVQVLRQDRDVLLYEESEEIKRLKAQVERLTKAGDAMAKLMVSEYGQRECKKIPEYINWNAAKEGKQP